jgi:hypothetical protein
MSLMEFQWHPNQRQLRVFGVAGLAALSVAALVLHLVWGVALPWAVGVFAMGAALFLCSRISPGATRILYLGLTIAAMPLGLAVSFILLAAFYFLLVTPVAVIFKLIGRDALCRKFDTTAASYWVPHRPSENLERYFHQF